MKLLYGKRRKDQPRISLRDNESYPTSQTTDYERNPDTFYKIFKSHCPTEMNEPESAFYFDIKREQNPGDIWYRKSPLRLVPI